MRPSRFFSTLGLAALLSALLGAGCARAPETPAPLAGAPLAALPPELETALAAFRAEGPRGWAFTQSTQGQGKALVERFDPSARGAARWTLLQTEGRAPTAEEAQRYRDSRPLHDSVSDLSGQLDRTQVSLVSEDATSSVYEFALRPAGEKDRAAAHMRARFTLDRASGSIVLAELFNYRPFQPARSLSIEEARTTLKFASPTEGRPALPLEVKMVVRGERFWVRDFSSEVTSTFSEHSPVLPSKTSSLSLQTAPTAEATAATD
jgi:hypothetical protein